MSLCRRLRLAFGRACAHFAASGSSLGNRDQRRGGASGMLDRGMR